jgi:enoyl-CoA hydratase/carnithine racemase
MSELRVERSGAITTITLDRPAKMNALSGALVDALLEAVDAAHRDGTRLVVVRGEGKNLSAGFDFGGYESQSEGDLLLRFTRIEQLLQMVHHAPFETLALAHGRNFGAGVDLIGACSRRVATTEATFRMPGLRFGLVLGTRRFALQVGGDTARDVLAESKTFAADEALTMGFLTQVAGIPEWPEVVARAAEAAEALQPEAHARLVAATRVDTRDADLAELVRSAAAPGLKMRIAEYLAPVVTPGGSAPEPAPAIGKPGARGPTSKK